MYVIMLGKDRNLNLLFVFGVDHAHGLFVFLSRIFLIRNFCDEFELVSVYVIMTRKHLLIWTSLLNYTDSFLRENNGMIFPTMVGTSKFPN